MLLSEPDGRFRLPTRQYLAAHERNIGVLMETLHDAFYPILRQNEVIVGDDVSPTAHLGESGVQRVRLALFAFKEVAEIVVPVSDEAFHYAARVVTGVVIHNQNFVSELAFGLLRERGLKQLSQVVTAIVGADEHSNIHMHFLILSCIESLSH